MAGIGAIIGAVGSLASGFMGAAAARAQAAQQVAELKHRNKQLEINRDLAMARGQIRGQEEMKRAGLAESARMARGAAGGFATYGASDEALADAIHGEGTDRQHYQQGLGANEAEGIETEIGGNKISMWGIKQGAQYSAIGSILEGFGNAFGGLGGGSGGTSAPTLRYAPTASYRPPAYM